MQTDSKQLYFLLAILFVACGVAYFTFFKSEEPVVMSEDIQIEQRTISSVKINDGTVIPVMIADSDTERQQGLSGRSDLKPGTGMLFIFDKPGKHTFWMKDMNFPIDIIWISKENTIVHVEKNVSPDTFPQLFAPSKNALFVLEVPAGFADAHGLYMADQVIFQ